MAFAAMNMAANVGGANAQNLICHGTAAGDAAGAATVPAASTSTSAAGRMDLCLRSGEYRQILF